MGFLGASEILSRSALATQPVEIPGGGRVLVRELSVAQRGRFAERVRGGNPIGLVAWLVAEACVDEAGARLFTDEDAEKLEALSPRVFEAIGKAVMRVSGLTKGDEDDAEGEG